VAALGAAALALAAVPAAAATDGRGNTIEVRVQVPGVSGAPYVAALRRAVHGREISDVVVRVVTPRRVAAICGGAAQACYAGRSDGRGVITVPAATGAALQATLLHEYGHHVDNAHRHAAGREPNGTPRWWAARAMTRRTARGEVAPDYSRGWSRSTGEIFAEDYVRLNLALPWRLASVPAPSAAVLAAIRRDLTGRATGPAPRPVPGVVPPPGDAATGGRLVIARRGVLRGGRTASVPFGLLGPGRSVRAAVRIAGPAGGRRVRVEIVCDGVGRGAAVATAARPAALARGGLGPGRCEARLVNLTSRVTVVTLRLTLTRPGG